HPDPLPLEPVDLNLPDPLAALPDLDDDRIGGGFTDEEYSERFGRKATPTKVSQTKKTIISDRARTKAFTENAKKVEKILDSNFGVRSGAKRKRDNLLSKFNRSLEYGGKLHNSGLGREEGAFFDKTIKNRTRNSPRRKELTGRQKYFIRADIERQRRKIIPGTKKILTTTDAEKLKGIVRTGM
ncbi:MAG: hypothetical protein WCT37_04285, partial [Patescibacteria group bacterium]